MSSLEHVFARGVRSHRLSKYAIGAIIAGLGLIAIVAGLLTQPLDSLEGLGWPFGGLVLIVVGGFVARVGRDAELFAKTGLTWLSQQPQRIAWVYVIRGREGIRLRMYRDDGKLASLPLANDDDAAEAIVELKKRLSAARFGYRQEWFNEFHSG